VLATVLLFLFLFVGVCSAQAPASALQASNLLNPNVSAIVWFQGSAGRPPSAPEAFALKEVELGVQAAVDPYSRADAFFGIEDGSIEAEEAYLTLLALPGGFQARLGRMRARFGSFNPIHAPETSFADRPLAAEAFFGEEGLSVTGAELSWLAPLPFVLKLEAQTGPSPSAADAPAFDTARRQDVLAVGRLSSYADLSEAWNLSAGLSGASGANGQSFDPVGQSSATLRTTPFAADLVLRWKDPSRAIYRSFLWRTEVYSVRRELAPGDREDRQGFFSHADWQFARRWRAGYRHDWVKLLGAAGREQGGLAYLTFTPSEFSLFSLQGKRVHHPDDSHTWEGYLKATWSVGPHGAHPF
jgi:hypothetical protein